MRTLLAGVVGSTAYGLARPSSDIDMLGVFQADTFRLLGLDGLRKADETVHNTSAAFDTTSHEVGKFCRLALAGNPTILELLWLDEYRVNTADGMTLVKMRRAFLSRKQVRDSYLGYATQQFRLLERDSRFPDVPVSRIEKHARHMHRLLEQGLHLYKTGEIRIKVASPEATRQFGVDVARDAGYAKQALHRAEQDWDDAERVCPLPERPNRPLVDAWLTQLRVRNLR
jgi:predicted nucleotidyltransferase